MKELKKILVVDDDTDILAIVKMTLSKNSSFDVLTLDSGKKAIDEVERFQPDFILLDVMMPEIDGLSTLKILRTIPSAKNIAVAFFTAKVTQDEISSYTEYGVAGVIIKPFSPIDLSQQIIKLWTDHQKVVEEKNHG